MHSQVLTMGGGAEVNPSASFPPKQAKPLPGEGRGMPLSAESALGKETDHQEVKS